MTTPDTDVARVARGAALLDRQIGPPWAGWRGRVIPEFIDMTSPCMCPLGQLNPASTFFGTVERLARAAGVTDRGIAPMGWKVAHGFVSEARSRLPLGDDDDDLRERAAADRALADAWRAELTRQP